MHACMHAYIGNGYMHTKIHMLILGMVTYHFRMILLHGNHDGIAKLQITHKSWLKEQVINAATVSKKRHRGVELRESTLPIGYHILRRKKYDQERACIQVLVVRKKETRTGTKNVNKAGQTKNHKPSYSLRNSPCLRMVQVLPLWLTSYLRTSFS